MMIRGLNTFPLIDMPQNEKEIQQVLQSPFIKKIVVFALGPEGTNIVQAARQWMKRMNIAEKTEIHLCDTPELSLAEARKISDNGIVAVFWTCAVYVKEAEFFFTNPDILAFFFTEIMNLDEMQFATRQDLVVQVQNNGIPRSWKIASHPSPAPLVKDLGCKVVLVNSNSAAAKSCSVGEVEACITTESGRKIYGLVSLHSFGSPPMVFFGGTTSHGARVIKEAWEAWQKSQKSAG